MTTATRAAVTIFVPVDTFLVPLVAAVAVRCQRQPNVTGDPTSGAKSAVMTTAAA